MPAKPKKSLGKIENVYDNKISVFFKKSILKSILSILTMKHPGFRTMKAVKNINRLFTNLDLSKYQSSKELLAYVWCITHISKEWLDGIVDIDLIFEKLKREKDFDNIKGEIISNSIDSKEVVTSPDVKMLFNLIGEALQFGYVTSMREEYLSLLEDIDLNNPGAFRELTQRLFMISESLVDIKYNTNLVTNKITFNTHDVDSIKESVNQTISSLSKSNNVLKVGIRRLNTLLSPGYMNGRLYVYLGLAGGGKSLLLLKSALDTRKYNLNYMSKTPGMRPCVLYITMENSFTETIERVWNLIFDDPITNYSPEEASEMLMKELGTNSNPSDEDSPTIEIVIKYFSYREISTDDLFTIIQDLREDNLEVCELVLDYIMRIRPSISCPDNTLMELDRITNELKALAVMKDIPVITAHQMNRVAASIVDQAARNNKADATKLVGREHVSSAFNVIMNADFAAVLNIEYKPGTDDRYMVINVVKRRRIDTEEADFAKYTYLAHPFAKKGLKLIDDMNLDKVLSVQSLVTDIDGVGNEKTNAAPRLKIMKSSPFEEDDDLSDDI